MKKIIILRGNSGSGKTTIAKELQEKFGRNTMLISQDVIRRNILRVKDGENTLAISLMQELVIFGHEHNEIVIVEGILYSDWYQSLFELIANMYKTQLYAYYFDIPFEETLKRHLTKINSNEFGKKDMLRWWREKDLSFILNETVITSDKSKTDIVEEIYTRLMTKG